MVSENSCFRVKKNEAELRGINPKRLNSANLYNNAIFSRKLRCSLVQKLVFLFLFTGCMAVSAQPHFYKGYRCGLKFSLIGASATGGRTKTYLRPSFGGGIWLQLKINKKWTAQTEVLYVEKGAAGPWYSFSRFGTYSFDLNYVEIPVLFQYHKKNVFLEFGPGLAYLVSAKERWVGAFAPDLTSQYPFLKKELSFNFGLGYSFSKKWCLGLRFTHSVLPVRKQIPGIPQRVYNRVFTVSLVRNLRSKKQKTAETQFGE